MSNDFSERELELYKQFSQGQEKYEYFFMVLAGAAMAFAVKQTSGDVLNWTKLPLGIAVLLWGVSFFSGYKRRACSLSLIYSNFHLLHVENKNDKVKGMSIADQMEKEMDFSKRWARLQVYLFFFGMAMFVVWHIIEMRMRSHNV